MYEVHVIVKEVKRTISEWEQVLRIKLLDLDGFNQRDTRLMERLFTQSEFELAAAECTILRVGQSEVADHEDVYKPTHRANAEGEETRRTAKTKGHLRRTIVSFVLFTMPVIAFVLFSTLYNITRYFLKKRFRWHIPAAILFLDLLILLIQPFAVVFSGPFYVWYHVADSMHGFFMPLWAQVKYHIFHQSLNLIDVKKPLFNDVAIRSTPMNLYFGLPQAIVSSLFWGSFLGSMQTIKRAWRMNR